MIYRRFFLTFSFQFANRKPNGGAKRRLRCFCLWVLAILASAILIPKFTICFT